MSIAELLKLIGKYPEVREVLERKVKQEIEELRYERSNTVLTRKIAALLKLLPKGFPGRGDLINMAVDLLRDISNRASRSFDNARRRFNRFSGNFSGVNNKNLTEEKRRTERTLREEDARRRRTTRGSGSGNRGYGGGNRGYGGGNRGYGGGNRGYGGGNNGGNNINAIIRRRRAVLGGGGGGAPPPPFPRGNGGPIFPPPPPPFFGGNSGPGLPPPPLPPIQTNAINNAGGPMKALNTVANVPGGAPEVAKAAEILNETGGNVNQAVNIKGANPAAVAAVQKLGGPENAVNVLQGLNTMAQAPATRKRKATRTVARPKKRGTGTRKVGRPRVAELNRVINAVKKRKLISLVAHNVTKTNNIHENDNRLKNYYKKVIKANILRTPFAKIARGAAKKRVM